MYHDQTNKKGQLCNWKKQQEARHFDFSGHFGHFLRIIQPSYTAAAAVAEGGRVVVLQPEGRQFDPQSSQKNLSAEVSLKLSCFNIDIDTKFLTLHQSPYLNRSLSL